MFNFFWTEKTGNMKIGGRAGSSGWRGRKRETERNEPVQMPVYACDRVHACQFRFADRNFQQNLPASSHIWQSKQGGPRASRVESASDAESTPDCSKSTGACVTKLPQGSRACIDRRLPTTADHTMEGRQRISALK